MVTATPTRAATPRRVIERAPAPETSKARSMEARIVVLSDLGYCLRRALGDREHRCRRWSRAAVVETALRYELELASGNLFKF